MLNEHVQFLKAALVKEHIDALTGSEFALLVLLGNSLLATAQACFLATLDQLLNLIKLFSHFYNKFSVLQFSVVRLLLADAAGN